MMEALESSENAHMVMLFQTLHQLPHMKSVQNLFHLNSVGKIYLETLRCTSNASWWSPFYRKQIFWSS